MTKDCVLLFVKALKTEATPCIIFSKTKILIFHYFSWEPLTTLVWTTGLMTVMGACVMMAAPRLPQASSAPVSAWMRRRRMRNWWRRKNKGLDLMKYR